LDLVSEAKLPALFSPVERQVPGEFVDAEIWRLSAIKNGVHDIWSQECALKHAVYIAMVHA
jgi:hypothetical protein